MKLSGLRKKTDKAISSDDHFCVISFFDMFAKVYNDEKKGISAYSLYTHSLDVASVARELISNMPTDVQILFKNAEFVAACHDIGKLSPCFFIKVTKNLLKEQTTAKSIYNYLCSNNNDNIDYTKVNEKEKSYGYHSTLGYDEFLDVFENKYALAKVILRHHGYDRNIYPYKINKKKECGGESWHKQRQALLISLKNEFNVNFDTDISENVSLLWSGLTAVSDWIASDIAFLQMSSQNLSYDEKAKIAIEKNGLNRVKVKTNLQFSEIFSFNQNKYKINRLQQATLEQVKNGGSLFIIEAPMGMGKTEAALYAAYELLQTQKARGIYFALPSRITSDTMCVRLNKFLDKILVEEDNQNRNAFLIYGKQGFLSSVGEDAAFDAKDVKGADILWFSNSKRKFLANFAVGTLDQALLSILPTKFNFVRYFGLAGKIVIIDEVHSYDIFTSTLLEKLIQSLLEAKCIVFLLSATLTIETKARLLKKDISEFKDQSTILISSVDINNNLKTNIVNSTLDRTYKLIHINTNEIVVRACEHAKAGNYVLMIENTVSNAQRLYLSLKEQNIDIEIILLHSRFIYADKNLIQERVLKVLGKTRKRARGVIVIGTQILEQSLDIDADILFTNLAPIDLIFQRVGRCHRFQDPKRTSEPIVYIYGTNMSRLEEESYNIFDNSKYIYDPYILAKTALCLQNLTSLSIPKDIRLLLEKVYSKQKESGVLADLQYYSQNGLKDLGLIGSKNLKLEALENLYSSDESSLTRYSNTSCIGVLIMTQDFKFQDNNIILNLKDHNYDLCKVRTFCKEDQASLIEYLEKHVVYLSNYKNRYSKYIAENEFIKKFGFNILLDQVYYYAKIDNNNRVVFIKNINVSKISPYCYSSQYGFMCEDKIVG